MSESNLLMVNLGCGTRFHPDWANFDLTPVAPAVRQANFIAGIPLSDGTASAVYHSHVLEHLPLDVARRFLRECRRVLAPGGVIRVVVPDLEQTVRDYLAVLDARRAGRGRAADHRWMLIEMFDQMVRSKAGGAFTEMLAEGAGNDDFVLPRVGAFGGQLAAATRAARSSNGGGSLKSRLFRGLTGLLPGRLGETIREVRYRRGGELHMWMYDELFLRDMLEAAGFTDVRRESAATSSIAEFGRYGLDVEPDGTPWKGMSLYVEARRSSGGT